MSNHLFIKRIAKLYFSRGFYISGPQFFSIVVQLITLPIVLRSIPEDMYGGFQFTSSVFLWVTLFSVGHLTLGASRGIATDKLGTFLYAFLYRLRIIVPLGIILMVGAYFYDSNIGAFQQLLMIVGGYLVIGYLPQVSFSEFFVAKQQFKSYFVWQTILSVLAPVLAAFAALITHNVLVYALVQFGAVSAVSVVGFVWVCVRNKAIASYRKGEIDYDVVRYGFSLIPAEIIQGTSVQITSFIIGPFFGFVHLAVYSVAARIDSAVRNFLASFYHVWYADFARKDFAELKAIIRAKHASIFLISICISVLVAVPGFLYIRYAVPQSYAGASGLYLILVAGFPAVLLQTILYTFLAAHLRYRALIFSGIFPSIAKIALIVLCGFLFGILGIAVAVAISAWVSYAFYYASVFHKEFLLSLFPRWLRGEAFYDSNNE